MMTIKEHIFIVSVLVLIILLVVVDLITDSTKGVVTWHILVESLVALMAATGIFFLLYGSLRMKHSLRKEKDCVMTLQAEAAVWREQSRKFIDGLKDSIHMQLTSWSLTPSEREVALLLLKGLSLKEIASVRKTKEKTIRSQCVSIYNKSGLSGRSELAAFFLEDLFDQKSS